MKAASALFVAMLLLASCAAEEIVIATSDGAPADGGLHPPPLHPCMTKDECRPDEFCSKPTCQDATGDCVRRPVVVRPDLSPTCGCDGITYFNDDWRKMKQIASSTPGECGANAVRCGGLPYVLCPPPAHCAQLLYDPPAQSCPVDVPGNCWVIPSQCSANAPGDIYRWMPCETAGPCVDTCSAIGPQMPFWRMPGGCP